MIMKSLTNNFATLIFAVAFLLSAITFFPTTTSAQTKYDSSQDARISALEARRRGTGRRTVSKTPGRLSALEQKSKDNDVTDKRQDDERNQDIKDQKAKDDGQDRDLVNLDDRVSLLESLRYPGFILFWILVIAIPVLVVGGLVWMLMHGRGNRQRNNRLDAVENRLTAVEAFDGRITTAQGTADAAMLRANAARRATRRLNREGRALETRVGAVETTANNAAAAPFVSGITNAGTGAPNAPAAGGVIQITGGNFAATTTATVNGVTVPVTVLNPGVIQITVPGGTAGETAYVVVTCNGRTAVGMFSYV